MDELALATSAERSDLGGAIWNVNKQAFSEFMYHDPVAAEFFEELYDSFPSYQFVLLAADDDVCVTGNAIPFRWDRPLAALPDRGWDYVLEQGMRDDDAGRVPNLVSALQIVVRKDLNGRGLAAQGLAAMRHVVAAGGFKDLVAPVRPNHKHHYPLTPMERYVTWTAPDGLAFDPWMRVHQRAGATVLKVCEQSMLITGSVAEWEERTQMAFPESGQYVVPDALNPVVIDVEADRGTYVEPNVWMHHRLG